MDLVGRILYLKEKTHVRAMGIVVNVFIGKDYCEVYSFKHEKAVYLTLKYRKLYYLNSKGKLRRARC